MKSKVVCTNCGRPYPEEATPYRCPTCGGVFDFTGLPPFDPGLVDNNLPGIWRYRHTFYEPATLPIVTLGEGNTPLVWAGAFDRQVAFKLEYLNPTGSFKDRGSAPMVSFLAAQGVSTAVEDSSGNAGSSFAAYAARAGIAARVYVPDYASGPKRTQIQAYGAELVRILGPRSNASQAVRRAADQGAIYASHVFLPFGLAGFATLAYELVDQLGELPGSILMPVGQGSLLLGMARGFEALKAAGVTGTVPQFIGVQALACAPLFAVSTAGAAGLRWVTEGPTLAEGIRIKRPERGDVVLKAVEASGGRFIAVDEPDIMPGRDRLARLGLFVEPTSAVVWPALAQVAASAPEPIVVILTGSGFKQPE